ncbi:hypothetical protein PHMEG_0002452 [Phytophthora megakarya]|uniref:Uncharacterized protein n=1 Tax=Phytophthora megakarya TaxID=4795 RepID=A0A225X0Q4_9STRA|nr:hypothetical protein PHMEG_0002452 [Phytophthora megakarya]
MVGNKHKNGIICTFPNCNKPMRTQKFKMHFTRAHLKDGEEYSIEHRRQYEVAREENALSAVKQELEAPAAVEISSINIQVPQASQAPVQLEAAVAEQTSGTKRPASAMEISVDAVDPTSVLLMQFIALMDQRFQELVGKMGEMIDVQKDLIDTLQGTNPSGAAPASAFSHAVEVVMKRRKHDTTPSDNNDGKDSGNGVAL